MTDSSAAGYLVEVSPTNELDENFILDQSVLTPGNLMDDDDLFDFFHDYIAGITGLAAQVVIPRWQDEAPNIPTSTNWCGFGVVDYVSDTFTSEGLNAAAVFEQHRQEEVHLLASFYGPNCGAYARTLRDGMQLSQNREVLQLNGMGFKESSEVIMLPTLLKEKWLRRADINFIIRRAVIRTAPVLSIIGNSLTINNERYTETVDLTKL